MFAPTKSIASTDPEIAGAIDEERRRQEEHIELIASENYASPAVMEAQGTVLTNKYAEGYPRKRYYGGCEYVDVAETLAIERVKALFKADYANVQPHSGSQANAAAYLALLNPGDTVLGMSLAHGGHLTHGAKVNFSGRLYNAVQYGLNADTGEVDYDEVARLARTHRPKMLVAGFSAYSRRMDWLRFRRIADDVGAYLLVDMAHVAGLVAADLYPNPVSVADVTTSTTHKTLRGPRGRRHSGQGQPGCGEEAQLGAFPRFPRRPLDACHRRQGGVLQGGPSPGVQAVPSASARQRPSHGQLLRGAGLQGRLRRHGQPPVAAGPDRDRHYRQGRGRRLGARQHHRQQERRAQ